MALIAVLAGERSLASHLAYLVEPPHSVVQGRSWGGFRRIVHERPVTGAIVALEAVEPNPSFDGALADLRDRYPHLGLVVLVRGRCDPFTLFRLGRARIKHLQLLAARDLSSDLARSISRSCENGATAQVMRLLSPVLPRRELGVVHLAMDSVHRLWTAEELAAEVGLTRPFLSERMKTFGLPSLGHLLLWTRLFHAGHWLEDPGRTGESVGRQLEYSSGAAFRRALRHYVGATPTQVKERGGLRLVLETFIKRSTISAPSWDWRVTVA